MNAASPAIASGRTHDHVSPHCEVAACRQVPEVGLGELRFRRLRRILKPGIAITYAFDCVGRRDDHAKDVFSGKSSPKRPMPNIRQAREAPPGFPSLTTSNTSASGRLFQHPSHCPPKFPDRGLRLPVTGRNPFFMPSTARQCNNQLQFLCK
jgi:hypothetical protein